MNSDMDPGEGYAWAPVPGTAGNFQFLSDSFVLPVGAPHRDAAIAWLTVAGSQAGQDAFNPVKGSIPARSDGDVSLYGEYLQSAMDDWASDTVVGSLTHGVVANDSWKSEIDTALGSSWAPATWQDSRVHWLRLCRFRRMPISYKLDEGVRSADAHPSFYKRGR